MLNTVEVLAARRALMLVEEVLEGLATMARDASGPERSGPKGAETPLCLALRDIYGRVADIVSELDARLKKKD